MLEGGFDGGDTARLGFSVRRESYYNIVQIRR